MRHVRVDPDPPDDFEHDPEAMYIAKMASNSCMGWPMDQSSRKEGLELICVILWSTNE